MVVRGETTVLTDVQGEKMRRSTKPTEEKVSGRDAFSTGSCGMEGVVHSELFCTEECRYEGAPRNLRMHSTCLYPLPRIQLKQGEHETSLPPFKTSYTFFFSSLDPTQIATLCSLCFLILRRFGITWTSSVFFL